MVTLDSSDAEVAQTMTSLGKALARMTKDLELML